MNVTDRPAATADCLSADALAAFSVGNLAPAAVEAAGAHLAACPSCAAALAALPPEDDPLLQRLRASAPPETERLARTPAEPRPAPTPRAVPPGSRFGPYVLLDLLAQGGMGVVYKALQRPLNRIVALKMLRYGPVAGAEAQSRFRSEGEAVARLDHPHIVRIYELGELSGEQYFSMEYVEGGTLARRLAAGPLPERDAAALVETLAHAVQYAHDRQVLHRDLKPGNILLAVSSEQWAVGSTTDTDSSPPTTHRTLLTAPKVSDFGLAKLLDAPGQETATDAILGTPQYMAPEQVRGGAVGPGVDVYGLGAILYECLTGRPPFVGENRSAILDGVCHSDPDQPGRVRPGVDRGLEAICLTCLEKEPTKRYATARALADDLARWLRREPTHARPRGPIAKAARWARRHRVTTALVGLLLAVAGMAAAVPVWFDPDRPIRRLEGDLAVGKTVTLIGESGAPKWYRWQLGGDPVNTSLDADGYFAVKAWGTGLLELIRDPQSDRYRLRADLLHLTGGEHGEVGLYVAHRWDEVNDVRAHTFLTLRYTEMYDEVANAALLSGVKDQRFLPNRNSVRLTAWLYAHNGPRKIRADGFRNESRQLFQVTGNGRGLWRTVALEVSPGSVSGLWGNDELIGRVRTSDAIADVESAFVKHGLGGGAMVDRFPTRGGIGLYLVNGTALVRNVVVEPLPQGE